jgi:Glyoxalase-like domain
MLSRIDHVIIAGHDLDALEERFTRLGFYVTGGGTHPHLGTRNRIIILDESYIELLALADAGRASPALQRFIASGGGWVGYALQSNDIAAETSAIRARGIDARGPTRGRLVAPSGAVRSWRVTMLGSDDLWEAACPVPFLIQHDATGEAHRLELAGSSGLAAHPNGASRLAAVRICSRDTGALAAKYRTAYDLAEQRKTGTTPTTSSSSFRITLASGEYIGIDPLPRPQDRLGQAGRDTQMSVRVHVADLAAIEDLHWHATVASTRYERTLIVRIPGINAEIECMGPRQ